MNIGFCGLGRMGTAMVERLVEKGQDVTVWNRTSSKTRKLAESGVKVGHSPSSVAQSSPIVLSILTDDDAVKSVYMGPDGLLSGQVEGKVFVEMSTIAPDTVRTLANTARDRGAEVVDCPVSGTTGPAREGNLLGFAGGTRESYERARGVLEHLCRRVDHIGPSGAGSAAKLAINLPLAVYWSVLGEAIALSTGAGVDTKLLLEIMMESSGGPNVLRNRAPKVLAALRQETADVGFDIDGMRKDLRSMIAVAEANGRDLQITRRALEMYDQAAGAGWGGRDASSLIAYYLQRQQ